MTALRGLRIDRARLWQRLEALAACTDPAAPWTRRSFTPRFEQGRAWLADRMREAGMQVHVDAGGNLVGRLAGSVDGLPALATGSHSDTVPGGGRFDGILGVLSGIEVAQCLHQSGLRLRHPLEVVDFLAEEPSDYGVSCIGSRAWAGELSAAMLAACAPGGESLAEGLRRVGGVPERLQGALRRPEDFRAFIELHIEQGPVLEDEGLPIGVVSAIVGIRRWRLRVIGRPDHAGTTPMDLRRDALVGAAQIVTGVALEAAGVPRDRGYAVATVGKLDVQPNAANAVPGVVEFVLEMRSDHDDVLDRLWLRVEELARQTVEHAGLALEIVPLTAGRPALCHEGAMSAIEAASKSLGLASRRLVSGAGHDAVYMTRLCTTGMIFVPCLNGRSHCAEEWATSDQIGDGTDVLLHTLIELDGPRTDA